MIGLWEDLRISVARDWASRRWEYENWIFYILSDKSINFEALHIYVFS